MNEIWISIRGFEDQYEISSYGRIRSKDHMVLRSSGSTVKLYTYLGNYIKPTIAHNGYVRITLNKNGRRSSFGLARLVAKHFLIDYSDDKQIVFVDGDPTNCKSSNLRWKR